jgi:uncharacterized membrane protein YhaH (DUF805 family)
MRKQAIPMSDLSGRPVTDCGWSWFWFFFTVFAFMGNKFFFMIFGIIFILKMLLA